MQILTSNQTRPNAICILAKEILNSIEVQQMELRHSNFVCTGRLRGLARDGTWIQQGKFAKLF